MCIHTLHCMIAHMSAKMSYKCIFAYSMKIFLNHLLTTRVSMTWCGFASLSHASSYPFNNSLIPCQSHTTHFHFRVILIPNDGYNTINKSCSNCCSCSTTRCCVKLRGSSKVYLSFGWSLKNLTSSPISICYSDSLSNYNLTLSLSNVAELQNHMNQQGAQL